MKAAAPALALLAVLAAFAGRADSPPSAAESAATTWLALVDAGDYYQSWAIASDQFRNSVSRSQWVQAATRAREPLGALKSRRLTSATPAHTLPGAPDGDYVVIRYASSFANKAAAVETVTPMKDSDGHWRVSGYFVK